MEDKDVQTSVSRGSPASSRWNPTKEQISMLEALYRQGIRTPNAEQIQQITSRLRVHGHIEGKNVFYWFQNHKARQRQKLKQENMVYVNRFLHKAAPVFVPSPAPCTNVVCSPLCIPQSAIGFYSHHPKVRLPNGFRRRPKVDKVEKSNESGGGVGYELQHPQSNIMYRGIEKEEKFNTTNIQETLPLFPLHPTGILEGRPENLFPSTSNNDFNPSSRHEIGTEQGSKDQHVFDFLSEHASCENE